MKLLTIFCGMFFSFAAFTQSPNLEYKAKYMQAVSDYKNQKTVSARAIFETLKTSENEYTPYIYYYLAKIDFELKKTEDAENQIVSLINKYPKWNQIQEANFLLGQIYFSKKETFKALDQLAIINVPKFESSKNNLISQNLKSISTSNLDQLIQKYPKLEALKTLKNQITKINIFGLKADEIPNIGTKKERDFKKNGINIGVLLPFNIDSAFNGQATKNQFVFDMYEGMKLAAEKLKSENILVKLHTYDIKNSKNEMMELCQNSTFLEEDLLIGPVYSETNKIAQYYANTVKTPLVNPLSTNSQLIENKPYSYLNKAGNKSLAKRMVDFASENAFGEYLIINEKEDLVLELENNLKKRNLKYKKLKFSHNISLKNLGAKIAGVFLLTSPKNTEYTLNQIDTNLGQIPIWAPRDVFSENIYYRKEVDLYFFNQNFIDENNEKVINFKAEYWEKNHAICSIFTMKAFDSTLFWARQLAHAGGNINTSVSIAKELDEYLLEGFNYREIPNENAAFQITTLHKGLEVFYRKY